MAAGVTGKTIRRAQNGAHFTPARPRLRRLTEQPFTKGRIGDTFQDACGYGTLHAPFTLPAFANEN